ncbi:Flagellar motor switch protein FliN [Olavius sp. associated proteobacterium Delta 1]|nr:Flagellar motor switch protein FliN [Olavius sp. associated proteobacterium Delta 1]
MSDIENFNIRTHVIDSIVETFDTMVSMEIEVSDLEPPDTAGVSRMVAAVNFAGNAIGLINIQVTADLSRLMMANMLDLEPEEIEDESEIKDMLGEISNIVGGNLKSALNDAGHPCVISTPSLTYGADFTIKSLSMDRFERYVFSYQEELIFVEVGLKAQQITGDGDDFSSTDVLGKLAHVDIEKINALDIKAQVSEAVIDVFDTMLSARLEPTDTIPSESLEDLRNVGSVSFAGDATGMISIQVGDNFARALAAEMLGMEIEELEGDEEIKDMMGEVANIVGGNLKSAFTDAGLACALSTPSFTTGTDFRIESLNMEKYERFAFRSDDNIVFVEMGVKISELVQAAGQQGKDIHYAVGDKDAENDTAEEAVTAAPQEVNEVQETAAAQAPAKEPPPSDSPSQPAAAQTAQPPPAAPPVQEAAPHSPASSGTKRPEDFDLDLLLDIPLEIKVELGRTRIQIQELLNLSPGSAVRLVRLEGEPVDILANDTLIARGEVVVQNEKYGIRVTEITSRLDRIRSFSI